MSVSLTRCADYALRDIATRICDGDASQWKRADKIERRFRLQGFTLARVNQWQTANAQFEREESKRHDAMYPDRLTYLHR